MADRIGCVQRALNITGARIAELNDAVLLRGIGWPVGGALGTSVMVDKANLHWFDQEHLYVLKLVIKVSNGTLVRLPEALGEGASDRQRVG